MEHEELIRNFDLVIDKVDKPHEFFIENIIRNDILNDREYQYDEIVELLNAITEFATSYGYVQIYPGGNQLAKLTPKGRELKQYGKGHKKFVKNSLPNKEYRLKKIHVVAYLILSVATLTLSYYTYKFRTTSQVLQVEKENLIDSLKSQQKSFSHRIDSLNRTFQSNSMLNQDLLNKK